MKKPRDRLIAARINLDLLENLQTHYDCMTISDLVNTALQEMYNNIGFEEEIAALIRPAPNASTPALSTPHHEEMTPSEIAEADELDMFS
jgi:hypothetical protein